MAETAKNAPTIGDGTAWAMVGLSVIVWLLQLLFSFLIIIPGLIIVPPLLGLFAFIGFFVWFKTCNVDYLGGKQGGLRLATGLFAVVLDFIPIFDGLLPEVPGAVIMTVITSRMEDAEKARVASQTPRKSLARTATTIAQVAQPELAPAIEQAKRANDTAERLRTANQARKDEVGRKEAGEFARDGFPEPV